MIDYAKLFDLSGKVAVVLGAGSGIGQACAHALAAMGAHVVCADRDEGAAAQTCAQILAKGSAQSLRTDAASAQDVQTLAETVIETHGRVDIAVSTPALNVRKLVLDYTLEDYERVMNLNMSGSFHFLRAFGAHMVQQRSGSLILCSSMRAVTLEPGLAIYGSTKAAIAQMVRGFACEVGQYGVRVNAIMPSIIETKLTEPLKEKPQIYNTYAAHTILNRWGQPHEVGSVVAFLASEAASYITGSNLVIDGGWTAIDGPPTGLTATRPSN